MSEAPSPCTVVVVDDERSFAHMLSRMLEDRGFAAVEAHDGTSALTIVGERAVDVLLCDVVMPGLAGTALLRAIRALPGNAALPVIFMSALPEKRVRNLVAGEYGFLAKPFMIDAAVAALTGCAGRPAARAMRHSG